MRPTNPFARARIYILQASFLYLIGGLAAGWMFANREYLPALLISVGLTHFILKRTSKLLLAILEALGVELTVSLNETDDNREGGENEAFP